MFQSPTKSIWWLPSFGFFLFVAIECWMFVSPSHIFEDPGVGRHLRAAEVILETGQVPHTDPLSFNRAGQPWVDFEWAFEATLGELFRAGGLPLVCGFCFSIFAATILCIYRTLLHAGFSLSVVLLTTGVAFLTLQIHFSARPVLFTYLFMAFVVEVWSRKPYPLRRDWLVLPLIFVTWANLHAGWLAAILFLFLAMAGRFLDRVFRKVEGEDAPIIPWLVLTLVCLLATSLSPWGWQLHRHIFWMATGLKSAALWVEDLPPSFFTPTMSAIAVMFVVIVVTLGRFSRRAPPWRWEAALPALVFVVEGLKAQRHVLLLMEVAAVPVARHLEVVLHGTWWPTLRKRLGEFQAQQRMAGGDAWLAMVAALVLTFLFMHTPAAQKIRVGSTVTPSLVRFLRDHPDRFHRPLTTTWNAGPLLWNLRPDFRVSFDDRGDFYGDETVYFLIDTMNGSPGWQEKLAKGKYDSLIVDPYLPINQGLHALPEWKEVYRDKNVVVYWRD